MAPQELAVHDGGEGGTHADRGHVEHQFDHRLAAQDGEGQCNGADRAQHEQVGREEDQADQQWHLLEDEVVGVAAVVQGHRQQVCDHPEHADDGEHRGLRDQEAERSQTPERAQEAEGDRGEGQGGAKCVDRRGDQPARPRLDVGGVGCVGGRQDQPN